MKRIFFLICFCLICLCSCEHKTFEDYKKETDERINQIIYTSKIERDGHTYIIFHNMYEAYGVVHDPDCCFK